MIDEVLAQQFAAAFVEDGVDIGGVGSRINVVESAFAAQFVQASDALSAALRFGADQIKFGDARHDHGVLAGLAAGVLVQAVRTGDIDDAHLLARIVGAEQLHGRGGQPVYALPLVGMAVGVEQVADVDRRLFGDILEGENNFGVGLLPENLVERIELVRPRRNEILGQTRRLGHLALRKHHAGLERQRGVARHVVVAFAGVEQRSRRVEVLLDQRPDIGGRAAGQLVERVFAQQRHAAPARHEAEIDIGPEIVRFASGADADFRIGELRRHGQQVVDLIERAVIAVPAVDDCRIQRAERRIDDVDRIVVGLGDVAAQNVAHDERASLRLVLHTVIHAQTQRRQILLGYGLRRNGRMRILVEHIRAGACEAEGAEQ